MAGILTLVNLFTELVGAQLVQNGDIVEFPVRGHGGISIHLSGTFTATVQFEASGNGVNVGSLTMTPAAGGTAVTSATATGQWQGTCVGMNFVQ